MMFSESGIPIVLSHTHSLSFVHDTLDAYCYYDVFLPKKPLHLVIFSKNISTYMNFHNLINKDLDFINQRCYKK